MCTYALVLAMDFSHTLSVHSSGQACGGPCHSQTSEQFLYAKTFIHINIDQTNPRPMSSFHEIRSSVAVLVILRLCLQLQALSFHRLNLVPSCSHSCYARLTAIRWFNLSRLTYLSILDFECYPDNLLYQCTQRQP